jgi:hypothetical protein
VIEGLGEDLVRLGVVDAVGNACHANGPRRCELPTYEPGVDGHPAAWRPTSPMRPGAPSD